MPCIFILIFAWSIAKISVMARMRVTLDSGGCYHAVSRIVERRFYFGEREKEFFVSTLRRLEAFLNVRVLTYCVMGNHFHLLLEIPGPNDVVRLTPQTLRDRLPLLYRRESLAAARDEIDRALAHADTPNGTSRWIDEIVARYQARLGDLSVFLKELKWRFSRWYNACNERVGALWEDRFWSVLVEGDEHALMTMAAYIELNPVRAKVVGDPKDYRWSGYGEAVSGKKLARLNLARLHGRMRAWQGAGRAPVTWREVAAAYRRYLFGEGEVRLGDGRTGVGAKPGIASERVEEVVETQGGELSLAEALRCRVRCFSRGAVIGSRGFVEAISEQKCGPFVEQRARSPHAMRGADWDGLNAMRNPR
jgi:REP element-mobilizing transposase RayT